LKKALDNIKVSFGSQNITFFLDNGTEIRSQPLNIT
jgi:hypothetical protein